MAAAAVPEPWVLLLHGAETSAEERRDHVEGAKMTALRYAQIIAAVVGRTGDTNGGALVSEVGKLLAGVAANVASLTHAHPSELVFAAPESLGELLVFVAYGKRAGHPRASLLRMISGGANVVFAALWEHLARVCADAGFRALYAAYVPFVAAFQWLCGLSEDTSKADEASRVGLSLLLNLERVPVEAERKLVRWVGLVVPPSALPVRAHARPNSPPTPPPPRPRPVPCPTPQLTTSDAAVQRDVVRTRQDAAIAQRLEELGRKRENEDALILALKTELARAREAQDRATYLEMCEQVSRPAPQGGVGPPAPPLETGSEGAEDLLCPEGQLEASPGDARASRERKRARSAEPGAESERASKRARK